MDTAYSPRRQGAKDPQGPRKDPTIRLADVSLGPVHRVQLCRGNSTAECRVLRVGAIGFLLTAVLERQGN